MTGDPAMAARTRLKLVERSIEPCTSTTSGGSPPSSTTWSVTARHITRSRCAYPLPPTQSSRGDVDEQDLGGRQRAQPEVPDLHEGQRRRGVPRSGGAALLDGVRPARRRDRLA